MSRPTPNHWIKMVDENSEQHGLISCACGCGLTRQRFNSQGREAKFLHGHNLIMQEIRKLKFKNLRRLSRHPNWKGGRHEDSHGYFIIKKPSHHFANNHGYVREHRLVWEQNNNASLLPWADVHHVNGDTLDNRPENLEAMMKRQHTIKHLVGYRTNIINTRICINCKSSTTYIDNKGVKRWYKFKNGYICQKCRNRLRYHNLV
jgi:hypothetical protein